MSGHTKGEGACDLCGGRGERVAGQSVYPCRCKLLRMGLRSPVDADLSAQNERLKATNAELLAALRDVLADLGSAEWALPEHGAELLTDIILKHYSPLHTLIAKAAGKEAPPC